MIDAVSEYDFTLDDCSRNQIYICIFHGVTFAILANIMIFDRKNFSGCSFKITEIWCRVTLLLHCLLFISEAVAAEAGGFKVCLVIRDGNAPLSDADKISFPIIYSFDELFSS